MPPDTLVQPFAAALQGWANFWLLAGTAAATLVGLMFIAVTFGASLVSEQSEASARAFIDPTYEHFVQVLGTALVLLVPGLGPGLLGALALGFGLWRTLALVPVYRQLRAAHQRHGDLEASDWVIGVVLPAVAHLGLMGTGAAFLAGWSGALAALAAVTSLLLAVGIRSAWELFVWMALALGSKRRPPEGP